MNADRKFLEVLNTYFTRDLEKNEAIIERFISTGDLYQED